MWFTLQHSHNRQLLHVLDSISIWLNFFLFVCQFRWNVIIAIPHVKHVSTSIACQNEVCECAAPVRIHRSAIQNSSVSDLSIFTWMGSVNSSNVTSSTTMLCASSAHSHTHAVTCNINIEVRWMKWTRKIQQMMAMVTKKNWCALISQHISQFSCLQCTCSIYIQRKRAHTHTQTRSFIFVVCTTRVNPIHIHIHIHTTCSNTQ